MKLAGQVAVVAGSGRGTGRAIAMELARNGADVVTNSLSENCTKVAEEIKALGRNSVAIQADLGTSEGARALANQAISAMGRVDMFVYNPAAERAGFFLDVTEQQWDEMQNLTLKGFFISSQIIARHMVEKGIKGRFVAISSVGGECGHPKVADYCAAKAGMGGLIRGMALDLAQFGIRANTVVPGYMQTSLDFPDVLGPKDLFDKWRQNTPLKRFAQLEEIGKAVLFLAGEDSGFCTGTQLRVDGGITLFNSPTAGDRDR